MHDTIQNLLFITIQYNKNFAFFMKFQHIQTI